MKTAILASAALAALTFGASAANATSFFFFDGTSGTFGDSGFTSSFDDVNTFDSAVGSYDISLTVSTSPGLTFSTISFDGVTLPETGSIGKSTIYSLNDLEVTKPGPISLDVAGTYVAPKGGPKSDSYGGSFTFTTAPVSAAPEPSTWMLMIAGVALTGGALRYGRRGWASAAA